MTIQYINTGTAPNQGNGDTLRTAFTKINSNFEQIAGNTVVGDTFGSIISDPTLQRGISVTYNTTTQKASFLVNIADADTLGAVRIGNGITVDQDGIISVSINTLVSGNSNLTLSSNGALVLDQQGAYNNVEVPGTLFRIDTSQPNYTQMTLQNKDGDTTATSDIIFVRDNGDVVAATGVLDIGINSSNYDEPQLFGVHTPGSAYMFTNDADLIIGTQNPGKRLVFHAGGSTAFDSAGYLDDYAWRFNRNVQVSFGTAGPLNFNVQNTMNNSAAQAVYQAMNNLGNYMKMGINSSNPGAVYGAIGPGEGFLHLDESTATMHIGGSGDIKFWSEESTGGYENGTTATLVMSRVDRSSTFGGHVLPATNLNYDLGSLSNQWRSLYVGTSTVYFGGVPLTVSAGGSLTVDGNVIGANTGDITFNANSIIGAGADSGDGLGYNTIKLVPDSSLFANDQYLIVDPTAPNHIHIRAGGTQDSSNALLILGGEKNNVTVQDNFGVIINNQSTNSVEYNGNDGVEFTNGYWSESTGGYVLELTSTNVNLISALFAFGNRPDNTLQVYDGNNYYTLTYGGSVQGLANDVYQMVVNEAPPSSPFNVIYIDFVIKSDTQNGFIIADNNALMTVNGSVGFYGKGLMTISNSSSNDPIQLVTNSTAGSPPTWTFRQDGITVLPNGTSFVPSICNANATDITANSGAWVGLKNNNGHNTISVSDNQIALMTNNQNVWWFKNDGTFKFPDGTLQSTAWKGSLETLYASYTPAVGTVLFGVRPPDGAGANNGYVWVPTVPAELQALGDITGYAITWEQGNWTTTVVQMRYDLGTSWAIQTADPFPAFGAGNSYIYTSPDFVPAAPNPLNVVVAANTWTFTTTGGLTFPDSTVQTTAWTTTSNYTATTASDWNGTPPSTIGEALDRLAALLKTLNNGTGA